MSRDMLGCATLARPANLSPAFRPVFSLFSSWSARFVLLLGEISNVQGAMDSLQKVSDMYSAP